MESFILFTILVYFTMFMEQSHKKKFRVEIAIVPKLTTVMASPQGCSTLQCITLYYKTSQKTVI